jgi:hypothetical protein
MLKFVNIKNHLINEMDYNDLINQRIKLKGVLLELKREVCYDAFDDKIRKQNILTIQASIKVLDNKIINFKG